MCTQIVFVCMYYGVYQIVFVCVLLHSKTHNTGQYTQTQHNTTKYTQMQQAGYALNAKEIAAFGFRFWGSAFRLVFTQHNTHKIIPKQHNRQAMG